MFKDFNDEIKAKLENDEIIKEDFMVSNYEMLKDSITLTAFAPNALMSTNDYSFNYHIIITNKRIFIGKANSYFKVISYDTYNLTDIENITTDYVKYKKKSKKFTTLNLYYLCGILPVTAVSYIMNRLIIAKYQLINNNILSIFLSICIPLAIIYACYRLLGNISKVKFFANLKFKDGKEISFLTPKLECLNFFKAPNC